MRTKIWPFFVCLALMMAGCTKENENGNGEPTTPTEDDTITHTLGSNDSELQKRERLSAEYYSPSKLLSRYYPIMVSRAVGSTQNPEAITWKPQKTRILYNMVGFTPDTTGTTYRATTNKYGSSTKLPRQTATGRYYTKKIGDRWWIIDPEGYVHYERSVTSFRKGGSARNAAAWAQRFGSDEAWTRITAEELAAIGFHGTGAFCTNTYQIIQAHNTAVPERPLSLSPSFHFIGAWKSSSGYAYPASASGDDYDKLIGLIFYPGWEEFCMEWAAKELAPYKGDPNVLGVYSDNELDFSSTNGDNPRILDRFLTILDDNDPAKKVALKFLEDKGITDPKQIDDWDNAEFAGIVAEQYYAPVRKAIKAVDPDMLYLGSRLHGQPKYLEGVIKTAGKYCDIISINYYSRWSVELDTKVSQWMKWTDTPFMVTEFYTKGMDSDLPNVSGAGFAVPTQYDRAYAYQHFTLGLLEAKNCVGWQWFKYQDDDFPDNDNQPANKGVYGNDYIMFPYLGDYMKNLNYNVYELINFFDSCPTK